MGTGSFHTWSFLWDELSRKSSATQQAILLKDWLGSVDEEDRFAAIRLLAGDAPKRLVTKKALLELYAERSTLPVWLIQECLAMAPDPCEAISLLEDGATDPSDQRLSDVMATLQTAGRHDAAQKASLITRHWDLLDRGSIHAFNRMVTGTFTNGLSRNTWIPAVASFMDIPPHALAHRLQGENWVRAGFTALSDKTFDERCIPRPFPQVVIQRETPNPVSDSRDAIWLPEGREAQLIRYGGHTLLWGRDFDEVFEGHDELNTAAECLPEGTVLHGAVLNLAAMSPDGKRIFQVWDVWEWDSEVPDIRSAIGRRALLSGFLAEHPVTGIQVAKGLTMYELDAWHRHGRVHGTMGVMLMQDGLPGEAERMIIHWPSVPHRIKAVLLYVQRDDGMQGPQYSFGLANGGEWITVARTGDGLSEEERDAIKAFAKNNTLRRFGPVRTVKAALVMELEIDKIRSSTRHKSGYLLEGVRIAAWRKDLGTGSADDLSILNSMKEQ